MPVRIEDALDFPVVSDVVRVAGEHTVCRYLEFELIKLSSLISVGGNFNNAQVVFIAQELVRVFPNETLADFKLCFHRGAIGQYGDIFRMDGIVLRQWMEKYLEEKYQVIEDKLMREKDDQYTHRKSEKPAPTTELKLEHQLPAGYPFAPVIKKEAREVLWLMTWNEGVTGVKSRKINSISTNEVLQEGQQKPKQQVYRNGYTPAYLQLKSKLHKVASDFYKGRTSYSNMKVHLIGEFEIFAESVKDAEEIYAIATNQE
jgi:hypothetical protein